MPHILLEHHIQLRRRSELQEYNFHQLIRILNILYSAYLRRLLSSRGYRGLKHQIDVNNINIRQDYHNLRLLHREYKYLHKELLSF